ncbi:hypothetical protein BIW11_07750 [Tropilaelaps mercedesae]|uniref:Uncharacterized protein n=1 Tax=Tropilaelaps mercedesae TaxID=418985 RepID=A0A1V9XSL6_9ACAR|nr:hypothetical protein BIW11_07750 [Tropilaelaps mercedesae]
MAARPWEVQQELVNGIQGFTKAKLRPTVTKEKVYVPTKEDIEAEKGHNQMVSGIQNFDASLLKHTETQEKNVLPTAEMIAEEKKGDQ